MNENMPAEEEKPSGRKLPETNPDEGWMHCPDCKFTVRVPHSCKKPRETRLILITLKNPVPLPVCLLDAIRLGRIEKISALDDAIVCTEIGHI